MTWVTLAGGNRAHPCTVGPHGGRRMILANSVRGEGYARHLNRGKRVNPDRPFTLVLSGGGLKGLAHIGVLRALEERGLVAEPGRGVEHRVADRGRLGRRGATPRPDGGAGAAGAAARRVPGGPRRRGLPPPAGARALPARAARNPGRQPGRRHHLPRSQAPPPRQHHRSPYRHAGDVGPARPARRAGGRRGGRLVRPARHLPAAGDRRPGLRRRRRGREPAGAPGGLARLRDRSSRSTSRPPASAGRPTRPRGSRPPTSAGSRS